MKFVKFPAVSLNKNENTNAISVDRFDINVIAANVIAINEVPFPPKEVTDVVSIVHFHPDTGLRPILSSMDAAELRRGVKMVTGKRFVTFAAEQVNTGEDDVKVFTTYSVGVLPQYVVAVNTLDGTTQQINDNVKSIIYFKPESAMQPILSQESDIDIMEKVAAL